MRFPSDDELMAGPNALGDARIEVPPGAADPEAEARAQIGAGPAGAEAAGTSGGADSGGAEDLDADGPGGDSRLGDAEDPDAGSADDDLSDLEDEADADLGAFEALASVASLRQDAAAAIGVPDYPEDFRAGFVSIVGRPNVGKSTLTNALVGQKVAITSGRPETTRHNIRGIVHGDGYQLVLVDTPGYHRPRTLLGKRLNDMVREALAEVDAVLFCLPADQRIGPGDQFIARELRGVKRPVIAVATKCDAVGRERVMKHLLAIERLGEWSAIVPVSSVEGKGIDHLRDVLAQTRSSRGSTGRATPVRPWWTSTSTSTWSATPRRRSSSGGAGRASRRSAPRRGATSRSCWASGCTWTCTCALPRTGSPTRRCWGASASEGSIVAVHNAGVNM